MSSFSFAFGAADTEQPEVAASEPSAPSSSFRAARVLSLDEIAADADGWPTEPVEVALGAQRLTKVNPPESVLPDLLRAELEEETQLEQALIAKGAPLIASTTAATLLTSSDLLPNVYEGGLKVWECARDLMEVLHDLTSCGELPLAGSSVLEAGCGAGLPGILTLRLGARTVVLQDYNAAVLRALTMPTVRLNEVWARAEAGRVRFISGDWARVNTLLLDERPTDSESEGFDVVLSADTLYSSSASQRLWQLVQTQLRPGGVALIAAKSYYFGCGGSVAEFKTLVGTDARFGCRTVRTFEDGASNRRECFAVDRTLEKN